MSYLAVKDHEADLYSKYVFKRYYYNKLLDWSQEPTVGLIGHSLKNLAKVLRVVLKPFNRDNYSIESNLARIEAELNRWQNTRNPIDPLPYFQKCGEAFGLVLRKAVLLGNGDSDTCKQMEALGRNIGMIITMRDSIQDLNRDRITGSFNPFFFWNESDIIDYYIIHSRTLRKDILLSAQSRNLEKIRIVSSSNQTNLFTSISVFAAAASNPFGFCKLQFKPTALRQATFSLLNDEIIEPEKPKRKSRTECRCSDTCAFDCCASKSEDCCQCGGPKSDEHKACCQVCDAGVECCSWCGDCASCM